MAFAEVPGDTPVAARRAYLPPPPPAVRTKPYERTGVARWLPPVAAAAGMIAVGAYVYLVDPNNAANPYPKCPMKAATGLDCPGCGGLRSVHSLLHGDLFGAFDHNALVMLALPLVAYMLIRWALGYVRVSLPIPRSFRFALWTMPIVALIFSIVRNIADTPFFYLNSL